MRKVTKGVILHSTRSGKFSPEAEYQKTIDYMMLFNTVSSHRVIGVLEGQHAQMVRDDLIAWHAASDNAEWLGIEHCQSLPTDPYTDWQIQTSIGVCVEWCRKYGIVPSTETLRRHSDTAQGKSSGKSDPGKPFPYVEFIEAVKAGV